MGHTPVPVTKQHWPDSPCPQPDVPGGACAKGTALPPQSHQTCWGPGLQAESCLQLVLPPVVFGCKQRDQGARFTEHGHSTSPTLASTLQLETHTWPKGLGREGIPLTNLCQPVPTPTTAFSWPQLQIKIPLQSTHAVHTRGGAGPCGQPWQHGSCPPANIFCQTHVFKRLLYLPSSGLRALHSLSRELLPRFENTPLTASVSRPETRRVQQVAQGLKTCVRARIGIQAHLTPKLCFEQRGSHPLALASSRTRCSQVVRTSTPLVCVGSPLSQAEICRG